MNNLPRVLLIDEDPSDRRLASLVLTGELGNVEMEAVGTAAEFSRALAAGRFGLVITEARFSWGDGLELIRLVREVRPDCPVILFTNETGEELWSETLRLAVDDYVGKTSGGFVRLPAVVRSVFFRSRRKAVASSRDAPYRRLVETLPVGVFVATLDARSSKPTPPSQPCSGLFDPEEIAWSTFPDLMVDSSAADAWRAGMASTRYVGNLDVQLRRADDDLMWARVSSWVVEDAGSGMRHIQGIVEDTRRFSCGAGGAFDSGRDPSPLQRRARAVRLRRVSRPPTTSERGLELPRAPRRQRPSTARGRGGVIPGSGGGGHREGPGDGRCSARLRSDRYPGRRFSSGRPQRRYWEASKTHCGKEITCAKAEITSDALPMVSADPAQMEQLLRNLDFERPQVLRWRACTGPAGSGGTGDRSGSFRFATRASGSTPRPPTASSSCSSGCTRRGSILEPGSASRSASESSIAMVVASGWSRSPGAGRHFTLQFHGGRLRPERNRSDWGSTWRLTESRAELQRLELVRVLLVEDSPRSRGSDLHQAQEGGASADRDHARRSAVERSRVPRRRRLRRGSARLLPTRWISASTPSGVSHDAAPQAADHRPHQPRRQRAGRTGSA